MVTDHFTQYVQACVTPSQTAKVVGQMIWDKYFVQYGLPEKILSNQGCNLGSSLITELYALSKIKKNSEPVLIGSKLMGNVKDSILPNINARDIAPASQDHLVGSHLHISACL